MWRLRPADGLVAMGTVWVGTGRSTGVATGLFPRAALPNRTCDSHRIRLAMYPVKRWLVRTAGPMAWESLFRYSGNGRFSSFLAGRVPRCRLPATGCLGLKLPVELSSRRFGVFAAASNAPMPF